MSRKLLADIKHVPNFTFSVLTWIASICLCAIVLSIVCNVVGRFFFQMPILGVEEIVEVLVVVVAVFAIAYTAYIRGHVSVELVTSRLSKRMKIIVCSITSFLSIVIFTIITYVSIISAITYVKKPEEVTFILAIPFAPFRVVMALGFLLLTIVLIMQMVQLLTNNKKEEEVTGK